MQVIIGQLPPADIDALSTITYTIGGMSLWPGNQSTEGGQSTRPADAPGASPTVST